MTLLRGLPLAMLLAAALPARAQQPERLEGYTVLSDGQFAALPATTAEGERYSIIYAKWFKVFGGILKLNPGSTPAQLNDGRLLVRDATLLAKLNSNTDADGSRLVAWRSNVQLLGTGVKTPQGYGLLVTKVRLLESDAEYGTRRAAALPANEAPKRTELARYLQARLARYYQGNNGQDPNERRELLLLMRRLEEEAGTIELQALPPLPAGAEERIAFGQRHQAIGVVAQVRAHPDVSTELKARAARVLREELHAQCYLGQWYAYEDWKDLLNFVRTPEGQWLPRERVDFRRACDESLKKIARGEPLMPLDESLLAASTEVVQGMNKDRVLVLLKTYPARVDRLREPGAQGRANVLEQWIMEDGTRIYFINGIVLKKVEAGGE